MEPKHRPLDPLVEMEIKQYPTPELVSILFPGHPVKGRRMILSPLRGDSNASFSMYVGEGGVYHWKDWGGERKAGDNVDLYREAVKGSNLSYPECVDALSRILFGKTAYIGEQEAKTVKAFVPRPRLHPVQKETPSVLVVKEVHPLLSEETPAELRDYWRSRGISDDVIASRCGYFVYENTALKRNNTSSAIGQYNDLGGVVFRVPETAEHKGFKGGTSSFLTTFLAGNLRPAFNCRFVGEGYNNISRLEYDLANRFLRINETQGFEGVSPFAFRIARPLLGTFGQRQLSYRETRCLSSVFSVIASPVSSSVYVKEGMFDDMSEIEIARRNGRNGFLHDSVILNSIENRCWAIPFLSIHRHVILCLDNDSRSLAGQKASEDIRNRVQEYSALVGTHPSIYNWSESFKEYNDLNDALCGRPSAKPEAKPVSEKTMNSNPHI